MINKETYKRLTVCVDSHLLDNGEESKEYGLSPNIKFNEFSCMDIPNAVYNKLGELEDKIENGTLKEIDDSLIGKKVFVIEINTVERRIRLSSSPWKILGFTKNGIIASHIYRLGCYEYYDDGFWFFDYDEAEAKLKELQEGKNEKR